MSKPRRHSLVWTQGLLCGAIVALATPTATLLGVLLGPALFALLLDREPGKPTGRCVALTSMAASVAPLKTLWMGEHNMAVAVALLGDLRIIATAWSAAAGGWLLVQMLPIGLRAFLEAHAIGRTARLRAVRTKLAELWGLDPAA